MDGRSVETWYRAGRHREIADYCLEDVRATAELYEKLAATLLIFNNDFKTSDEKDQRQKLADRSAVQIPMIPLEPASEENDLFTLATTLNDEV